MLLAAGIWPEDVERLKKEVSHCEDSDGGNRRSVSECKEHFDFSVACGVFDSLHSIRFVCLVVVLFLVTEMKIL